MEFVSSWSYRFEPLNYQKKCGESWKGSGNLHRFDKRDRSGARDCWHSPARSAHVVCQGYSLLRTYLLLCTYCYLKTMTVILICIYFYFMTVFLNYIFILQRSFCLKLFNSQPHFVYVTLFDDTPNKWQRRCKFFRSNYNKPYLSLSFYNHLERQKWPQ